MFHLSSIAIGLPFSFGAAVFFQSVTLKPDVFGGEALGPPLPLLKGGKQPDQTDRGLPELLQTKRHRFSIGG